MQSPERLKLLLLLTVADIRAVGPGVWNGWKGQLLRTLYYETEPLVAGGHTQVEARASAWPRRRRRFAHALADWPQDEVERFIDRHYPDYWLRTDEQRQRRARQAAAPRRERRAARSPPTSRPTPSRPSPS